MVLVAVRGVHVALVLVFVFVVVRRLGRVRGVLVRVVLVPVVHALVRRVDRLDGGLADALDDLVRIAKRLQVLGGLVDVSELLETVVGRLELDVHDADQVGTSVRLLSADRRRGRRGERLRR